MIRYLLAFAALAALLATPAAAQAPSPPTASTGATAAVSPSGATVTGTVNPRGAVTSYHVEYGTTTSYGLKSADADAGAGTADVRVTTGLAGLTAARTYHYRLVATNAAGTTRGADRTLRTAAIQPPLAATGPVGGLFDRGVTLTGSITPRGSATRYAFEWGAGSRLDRRTPLQDAGAGTAAVAVSAPLTLAPATRYRYRIIAINAGGTTRGKARSFTTTSAGAALGAAKLSVARADVEGSRLSVLAPISRLTSGDVRVGFEAAGRTTRFSSAIDANAGHVRFLRTLASDQARRGSGILTLTYPGNAATQPQQVRLRAARERAALAVTRPQVIGGRLLAAGTLSTRARGVVRLQLVLTAAGTTRTFEYKAAISGGRFRYEQPLPAEVLRLIGQRSGVLQSYTLFTGYLPARMRGEMKSYQVLPAP